MIASTALLAIWRPKLSETFLAPNDDASTASTRPSCSRSFSAGVSVSVRIWKLLYLPSVDAPATLDHRLRLADPRRLGPHLLERDGCRAS